MALRCYSFARTGEDAAYLAFDIPLEQVEQGLAALKTLGVGGAATAICVQAALDGAAEIAIFNRDDEFFANGRHTVEKLAQAVPGCKASINPAGGRRGPGRCGAALRHPGERHPCGHEAPGRRDVG